MPAQPHPVTAPAMTAGSSNNNTPTPPVAVAQPGDPESDTKAPQFIAASFDPPVVNDGATTTLNVLASDDLSGVKSITGNVIAPSGAVQAFGLGRDGDTNRFFTRITIAKDATAGIWHLNYLTLMDNAGNGTTASWKQGTVPDSASFRVDSSGSDSKPPDLVSVALDKPAVKGGDPETVVVQAQDDRSGVASISGVFLSPSGFARLGFSCRSDDGQSWRCDFVVPKGSECGDWTLDQMQLQDKAHNVVNLGRDSGLLSRVRMNVASDQCDSHPPVLQSVVLDKGVSTAPGMVVATLTVTDDSSGVASVGGTFVYSGPVAPSSQPPRVYLSCRNATGDQWTCNVAVPEKSPKGPYRLTSVQTLDKAQNLQVYDQSSPVLARIEFVVQ
jgi:hypothetical protein